MSRFFVDSEGIVNNTITLSGLDSAHIVKVLRLKMGDTITVCDGKGTDYTAVIKELDKHKVIANIENSSDSHGELPFKITLFQGVPKADKMDFVIQKCTELGISAIYPVITHRTIAQPQNSPHKIDRWQRIAYEAAKQSCRGTIPQVFPCVNFSQVVSRIFDYDQFLFAYEEQQHDRHFKEVLKSTPQPNTIGIFIGPEGGVDQTEIDSLPAGTNIVSLGKTILRTETAALFVLSSIIYHYS